MARRKVLITDFSAGMVSEKTSGRIDTTLSQKAAAEIHGFIVAPDGGIRRRSGSLSVYPAMGVPISDGGLVDANSVPGFVVTQRGESSDQRPMLVWWQNTPEQRVVARDLQSGDETDMGNAAYSGAPMSATPTVYAEPTADVTNQFSLIRRGDSVWRFNPYVPEIVAWSADEVAAIYANRLVLIDRRWGKIRTSVPLDMLNFDLTETVDTEEVATGAIEAIPDFYGNEQVKWIISRAGLYFGTDRAEYEITTTLGYISHDVGGFIIRKISDIGADQAVSHGSAMVLRKGNRLSRVQWSDNEQNYVAQSLGWLLDLADIVHIATVEHGSHRYLLVLDVTQRLYCVTESDPAGVSAFSVLMEDVWWFWEYNSDVFVARKHQSDFSIEVIPLDVVVQPGNRTIYDRRLQQENTVHGDRGEYLTATAAGITGGQLPITGVVDVYAYSEGKFEKITRAPTSSTGELNITVADVYQQTDPGAVLTIGDDMIIGGNVIGPHVTLGEFTIIGGGPIGWLSRSVEDVDLWAHDVKGEFTSSVKTLPLNIPGAIGPNIGGFKSVLGVTVLVHESAAFWIRVNDGEWESWESETLFTGPVPMSVDAAARETVQVEVRSVGSLPLTIMSIEADIQVADV